MPGRGDDLLGNLVGGLDCAGCGSHTCTRLEIWGYRREVAVACEPRDVSSPSPLRHSKGPPMHRHAVQSASGVLWCASLTFPGHPVWGLVESLFALRTACVWGVVCLHYRLQLPRWQLRSNLLLVP
jgi:hypothetical protein